VLLASLAIASHLAAQSPPRQPRASREQPPVVEPYNELIEVVETSLLIETDRRPAPGELVLLEGGVAREAIRVERLPRDEPWELLLWVDGPLCQQSALSSTLLGLAHRARDLTRLGPVRVMVAGDSTAREVVSTREPSALEAALAGLSAQELCTDQASALFWEAREAGTAAAGEQALRRLHELVGARARLLATYTGPCPAGACAVLLVDHGFPLNPDLRLPLAMRPASSPELADALAAETRANARRLAVARWMVLALPFEPPSSSEDKDDDAVPREARPGPAPFPSRHDERPGPAWRVWPPPGRVARREAVRGALPAKAWEVYMLPELAPLRALADATAGLVLRVPEQLPGALEVLSTRWRVWYRTVPFVAGETRSMEVLLGDPPRRTAAPAWVGLPATPDIVPAATPAPTADGSPPSR
jgi:hypothetical protein